MFPVYGLAEACLAVTFPPLDADYRWIRVNRRALGIGSPIELNPPDAKDVLELMCVGQAVPNTTLRIADDARAPLPEGRVGHILIGGPSVTRGYFGDPEETARVIDPQGWVDTGDLGVLHEGSLYVTGRAKEIIFINGMNYYPHDLENIATRAPGLDLNKVAAAGVAKPGSQGEELVVFVLHRGAMEDFLPTAAAVSRLINEHTGLEVAQVNVIADAVAVRSGGPRCVSSPRTVRSVFWLAKPFRHRGPFFCLQQHIALLFTLWILSAAPIARKFSALNVPVLISICSSLSC